MNDVPHFRLAWPMGGVGLFVDAKDERGATFYSRFGFESIPGAPLTLFLPMATLRLLATPDR